MTRRRLPGLSLALTLTAAPLALLAAGSPAPADVAEKCDFETATLVGPGEAGVLTGTEGDDVIVTNGATVVDALGGDDLICVTAVTDGLVLDAGEGDDHLFVYRFDEDAPAGRARTSAGARAEAAVTADLGAGDDLATVMNDDGEGQVYSPDSGVDTFAVDGGEGADALELDTWFQQAGEEALDGDIHVTGARAVLGGAVTVDHTGFDRIRAMGQGSVTMTGTGGRDVLAGFGCGGTTIQTGEGSDLLTLLEPDGDDDEYACKTTRGDGGNRLFGGAHGDRIVVDGSAVVRAGSGSDVVDARGACGAFAYHDTCGLTIHGEAGDDRILGSNGAGVQGIPDDGLDVLTGGPGNDTIFGFGGKDRIYGYGGNDRLYGGAGPDTLYGGTGRDLCRGEKRQGCER